MNYQELNLAPGLYFVAVPIGAARDVTLRALDVLASADFLVAEDTRSLRRLMEIHGVRLAGRPLRALHDHSKSAVVQELLDVVAAGKSVAYASEAGMPLIADPGFELVRAGVSSGVAMTCAPGPSAVLTALVLAGLPTDAFFFDGFLPNAASARRARLDTLAAIPGTLVFYESPKRLGAMLSDAAGVFGADRHAVVCRELTKRFEEVRRGRLADLTEEFSAAPTKGEIVVLIDRMRSQTVSEEGLRSALHRSLRAHSMRDAVDLVARAHAVPRRQVYQLALTLTKE
ncbi:MAG: 16S rRNA (cytidine(1402)-2'-O)-methyltransferase [Pseudomonadota bacterium]